MKFPTLVFCAIVLSACAQGGRVATGTKYAAVASQTVQILFQAPSWPAEQIGIVTSRGAQVASDATVYKELQHQAAVLGADAVLIISSQYDVMPGLPPIMPSDKEIFLAIIMDSTARLTSKQMPLPSGLKLVV